MKPRPFDYVRPDSADEAIARARPNTATTRACWPAGNR